MVKVTNAVVQALLIITKAVELVPLIDGLQVLGTCKNFYSHSENDVA